MLTSVILFFAVLLSHPVESTTLVCAISESGVKIAVSDFLGGGLNQDSTFEGILFNEGFKRDVAEKITNEVHAALIGQTRNVSQNSNCY